MTLAGVLIDVDRTLADTTYLHAVTWAETLSQQGRAVPTARVHRAVGAGTGELLDELVGTDRRVREATVAGRRHVLEAELKSDRQSPGPA